MTNQNLHIPCPVCKTSISFDTYQLLMGAQFPCMNCDAAISLAPESKTVVQNTMEKFESLKGRIS